MKLQALDLNLLVVMDALLTEGHLTRAAEKIGMTQPAASNALSRLRAALGDDLFVRTGGRMMPTALAQTLAPAVREALQRLRDALEGPERFDPRTLDRLFRVSMSDYGEAVLLPPMLARVRAEAPRTRIRLELPHALFEPPAERLIAGQVDLAVGFFSDAAARDPRFVWHPIITDELVFVARRGHPCTRGKLTLKRFTAVPHVRIIYSEDQQGGMIDVLLRARGAKRICLLTVPHFAALPYALAASDAVAAMPLRLAELYCQRWPLAMLKPPIATPQLTLAAVWHQRSHNDRAHAWFRTLTWTSKLQQPRVRRSA